VRYHAPHDAPDVPQVGLPAVLACDSGSVGHDIGADVVPLGCELLWGEVPAFPSSAHPVLPKFTISKSVLR